VSSRLEDYVARLEARLARSLPKEKAAQKAAEIRSHLQLAVEGSSEPDAERKAVLALGSESQLADDLIRAEKGLSRKSIWWWSLPSILFVAAIYGIVYNRNERGLDLQWEGAALFAGVVVLFFWSCLRSRRWLVVPVLAAVLVVAFTSVLIESSRNRLDPAARASRIHQVQLGYEEAQEQLAAVRRLAASAPSNDPDYLKAPIPVNVQVRSVFLPGDIGTRTEPRVGRVVAKTPAEAEALWKANEAAYIAQVESEVVMYATSVRHWSNDPNVVEAAIKGALAMSVFWGILFGVLNTAALGIGTVTRSVREANWRRRLA
jgi:hypothetical protein